MKRISLDAVRGNEKLAKEILSEIEIVLMREGTIIKSEYIAKLKELGVEYLYIEDDNTMEIELEPQALFNIKAECKKTVQTILEKYSHFGNAELKILAEVAEEIIYDILAQPKVMFNMYNVRKRSEEEYEHSINVATLSVMVSLKMKIKKAKIKEIAIGALLHDIGFFSVKANYKGKIYDVLKAEDQEDIKKHVIYGYSDILNEEWLSGIAKDIVLSHHEKIDGSGYPFKLKGSKIRIGSKIVAICDKFDRMVFGVGQKEYKVHEALEFIMSKSDIWYDIDVVKAFIESVAAYPTGVYVITNEGEIGVVIKQNNKLPTRPVLKMLKDKNGNNFEGKLLKDLTKELTIFIEDTLDYV